jgi:hypothetical protein
MDGPAPAIVNAVVDALGVHFDSVPLLPEDIMEKLDAARLALASGEVDAGGRR